MNLTATELVSAGAAFSAVLMTGSTLLSMNARLYAVQAILIAILTAILGDLRHEPSLYVIALIIALIYLHGKLRYDNGSVQNKS